MTRLPYLFGLATLAGCAALDPLNQPGAWSPAGANAANLRIMVANPHDLVMGAADRQALGDVMAAAIERYRTGRLKPLPASGAAKFEAGSPSDPAPAQAPN